MAMKSAFCCASLKTGTLIVGWLSLALLTIGVVFTSICASGLVTDGKDGNKAVVLTAHREFQDEMSLETYLYLFYTLSLVNLAVLLCLLYGTNKGRPSLLIPYLVVVGLAVAFNILLFVYRFVSGVHWMDIVPKLIAAPIGVYFLCIVGSHYGELCAGSQPLKNQV